MIVLSAWHRTCNAINLKPNLMPRDVAMRWNSTYDMLQFTVKYQIAINSITADKTLKLRKYELDNDNWRIMNNLVSILEVCVTTKYILISD